MPFKTYPAPHSEESVPRTCWTCKNHISVLTGITVCDRIPTDAHRKVGIEPCSEYRLDTVWLNVDWTYVSNGGEA